MLYAQPSTFSPPSDLSQPNQGVSTFSLSDYVSTSQLTGPLAGTYFTVEEGTASSSVSATSAVETSTLSVESATGSASGSAASGESTQDSGAMSAAKVPAFVVALGSGLAAMFAF